LKKCLIGIWIIEKFSLSLSLNQLKTHTMKKLSVTIAFAMVTSITFAQFNTKSVWKESKTFGVYGIMAGTAIGAIGAPMEPIKVNKDGSDIISDYNRRSAIVSPIIGCVSGAIVGMGVGAIKGYISNRKHKRSVAMWDKQIELANQVTLYAKN